MKKFLQVVCKLLLLSIIALIVLDITYTVIYANPVYYRNKVSWIKNINEGQHFDYAVFGSSRSFFHVNPKQISLATNRVGLNLAYPAATNFEIKLMVNAFLEKHHAKRIFIQVDKVYNIETIDHLAIMPWIPYLREEFIYKEIKKYDSLAFFKKHVPFYRYMLYDSKLGFRELSMSLLKDNKFEKNMGFCGIEGTMKKDKDFVIKDLQNKRNIHLLEIIEMCKKNQVVCHFFTAPYYRTDFKTQVLKENLPNYTDFSKSIDDITMFNDHQHLNALGAKAFTDIFAKTYFKNEN